MKMLLAATVAISLSIACDGGTTRPDVEDSRHVDYGRKFSYVARIVCRKAGRRDQCEASCVLIAPRWALTSAHVVDSMAEWEIVTDDGKKHAVSRVSIHEDYKASPPGRGDIAICRSETDFGLAWYPPLYAGSDEVGKVASIAGFGITGTFESGRAESGEGIRRAGSNIVDAVEGGCLTCSVGSGTPTSLEFLIAPGDSGGGLFIGNRLAGVNSHVFVSGSNPPRGVAGESSGHVRVSEYLGWIRKEMECDHDEGTAVRDIAD